MWRCPFDEGEFFTHAEIGWTSAPDRSYYDNFHITGWYSNEREEAGISEGWGLTFSGSWFFDGQWMPFVRGGYANDGGTLMEKSISTGVGYDVQPKRGLLAFGFNWGQPNKDTFGPGLREQYALELFYRLNLTEQFTITPDIQFLKNPALNPDEDSIWVFGLRVRMAL